MISLPIKRFLVFTLTIMMVITLTSFANAQDDTTTTVEEETAEITSEDLEVVSPGVLPTNPFYFFKEFGRSFQRLFIFNPVDRAEFELKVTNQKAAEIKALEDVDPDNIDALQKAIDNYTKSVERLRIRLEGLSETSDNPNVEKLLDKLTDRSLRHYQLFDELGERHEELRERTKRAKEGIDDAVKRTIDTKESLDKLKERIDRLFDEDSSPRKILQTIRLIDRLIDRAESEDMIEELNDIRDSLVERLEGATDNLDISIDDIIDNWPGGGEVKIRFIDAIGNKTRIDIRVRLDELRVRVKNKMKNDHEDEDDHSDDEDEHEDESDDIDEHDDEDDDDSDEDEDGSGGRN